jgi:hypothetical protein
MCEQLVRVQFQNRAMTSCSLRRLQERARTPRERHLPRRRTDEGVGMCEQLVRVQFQTASAGASLPTSSTTSAMEFSTRVGR